MQTTSIRRRAFLGGSAIALVPAAALRASPSTTGNTGEAFAYEVARSEQEWRGRLTEAEFKVLRKGSTEQPHTSPLVNETAAGLYCCNGCDLTLYDSVWKVPLDIGWVFFSHSMPNSILTGIDGAPPEGMADEDSPGTMIEAHCRRCGSHLGHIVIAEEKLVHCINGSALSFRPTAA